MNTIAKLRELEAKATKAPWFTNQSWRVFAGVGTPDLKVVCYSGNNIHSRSQLNNDNINLCSAARNALPALLDIAEAAGKDITAHAKPMVINHVKRWFINGHDVTDTVNALAKLEEVEL